MMYLTTAEAKAQGLGTVDEQIAKHNAAVAAVQAMYDAHIATQPRSKGVYWTNTANTSYTRIIKA